MAGVRLAIMRAWHNASTLSRTLPVKILRAYIFERSESVSFHSGHPR